MRIYDCFIFSNEWDLLRLRLDELDPVVDEFVIVQATTTFQGSAKEVVRLKNDSRFSQFSHKIRDIIVDNPVRGSPSIYNVTPPVASLTRPTPRTSFY